MSLPYESNATDWGKVRAVEAWIEYPFSSFGDSTSKIYRMKCVCKVASYVAPALSDNMGTATSADLVELPFTADSNAYFIGDTNFQYEDGGLMSFIRSFAPVPSTHYESIPYTHTYPAKRGWVDRAATGQPEEYAAILTNLSNLPHPPYEDRPPLTKDVLAKVTKSFAYSSSYGTDISLDTVFSISRAYGPEKLVIDTTGSGPTATFYNVNCPAMDAVDYVCNAQTTYADTVVPTLTNWPATSPTLTSYESSVSGGSLMTIKSYVEQWQGNIFMKTKIEVPYV